MDEFRIVAGEQACFVALEVFEAVEGNGAEGVDRAHVGIDAGRAGLEGKERRVEEEVVAALGLAGDGRVQVVVALQLAGKPEEVIDLAGEQFQLDFADRQALAAAFDVAAVDGQLDQRFAERHVPDLALEIGGEHRFQLVDAGFEKAAEILVIDMAEIEGARCGLGFPLAAHGQAAAGRFGGFDGAQPLPAFLAKAHGDAALVQFEARRVEIGVEQVLVLRRDVGQQRVFGEPGCGLGAQLQLEFDFGAHRSLSDGAGADIAGCSA